MRNSRRIIASKRFLAAFFVLVCSLDSVHVSGQEQSQKPYQIRVGVTLVQTDVMVFDRDNNFVENLRPEQFELRVDGAIQPVSFFDLVYAGTPHDEEIWAKMSPKSEASGSVSSTVPSRTGRTILFFVDDWHISADSMIRAKVALKNLVDTSVGAGDRAAIVAASGQLGFLQQFTGDKSVLQATVAKLAGGSVVEDRSWPPMNEAHAAKILQGDTALFNHFVRLYLQKSNVPVALARDHIQTKVMMLGNQSSVLAQRSLGALQDFVRSASAQPGRKLIFFLSDGFALQMAISDIVYRINRLTTAAANAGIVIYTMDTRGLATGLNATNPLPLPTGTFYNDVWDFQDGLNALAADTGGRFLHNTNSLDTAISVAMAEASRYYLLGWYADADSLKPGNYWSLKVAVKDRPDLKVRLRAGRVDLSQSVAMLQEKRYKPVVNAKDGPTQLRHALEAPFQFHEVPVSLYAGRIIDPDKGPAVAVSYQVDLDAESAKEGATAEIMGGIANQDGITVDSFSETLSPSAGERTQTTGSVTLTYIRKFYLEPGSYQIRVAARDPVTGQLGSAWQWVQVPSKEALEMRLSSIFLREQGSGSVPGDVRLNLDAVNRARFSIKRRFMPDSRVRFFVNVHDAAGPNLLIRTAIFQGNHPVGPVPEQSIAASPGDLERHLIPVSGILTFRNLAPGPHTLEVEILDSATKTKITERISFEVMQPAGRAPDPMIR